MSPRPSDSNAPDVLLSGKRDPSRELMLQTYDSVLLPRSAIYCSAPITSGRRYVEWLAGRRDRHIVDDLSEADRTLHRQQVIEPNKTHAKQIADRLRQRSTKPVIDPTAIGPISGWRQADWIAFWEEVIARFAAEVVLIDGWEFSYGCTHEFWFALNRNLPVFDEAGRALSASDGAQRIRQAIAELERAGADATRLHRVLELLQGIKS